MPFFPNEIKYTERFKTNDYEYTHVILPKSYLQRISNQVMSENEWRSLGISLGTAWENFMIFKPERHVILFRRKINE